MDVMEFTRRLGQEDMDAGVDRWVDHFQDFVARQTLYLCRHLNRLPASLREDYWDILQSALVVLPEGSYIEVTPDLDRHLQAAAPQGLETLIKKRVHVINTNK
jgi:hypothetical protein